jgi:hypothetical protein
MSPVSVKKNKDLTRFHQELVNSLLAQAGPVKPMTSPWAQWSLWILLATALVFLALWRMKPTHLDASVQPTAIGYLITLFLSAALAAWQAVVSSIPGRPSGSWQLVLLTVFLATIIIIFPFVFFVPKGEEIFEMDNIVKCWPDCFKAIFLIGILPWILLGWRLSQNASFNARWTGAWSGLSAFLLGSLVTLMRCGYWEAGHMLAVHLLTVAIFSFLTTWLGAMWFSRWKR